MLTKHKQTIKDLALSFSAANLLFVRSTAGLLYGNECGFFTLYPLTNGMLLALMLNLAWATALSFLVLRWARSSPPWGRFVTLLGASFALFVTCDFVRLNIGQLWPPFGFIKQIQFREILHFYLVLLGLILLFNKHSIRILRKAIFILVPLALLNGFNLGWKLIQGRPEYPPVAHASLLKQQSDTPRVLWILFDAMNQTDAFLERPPQIRLPELDRFKSEAIYATNAHAPGIITMESVPSLLMGQIAKSEPLPLSEILFCLDGATNVYRFSRQPNVFSDFRQLGANSAAAGWYLPYGRLSTNVLSYGAETSMMFDNIRGATFGENMRLQIEGMFYQLLMRWQHQQGYEKGLQTILPLVTNTDYHLVFWHACVPHLPGIWDPASDHMTIFEFTKSRGYPANYEIADQALGIVRRAMEKNGAWDKTWIIISSDHSCSASKNYSTGRLEEPIPFLVKPPGYTKPTVIEHEFNTVLTRHLVAAIARKEVKTSDDVIKWIESEIKTPRQMPAPVQ